MSSNVMLNALSISPRCVGSVGSVTEVGAALPTASRLFFGGLSAREGNESKNQQKGRLLVDALWGLGAAMRQLGCSEVSSARGLERFSTIYLTC